ncbi:MAG: sulfatase-like hydrolase/transferase [Bacteroidota bacterium]
MRVLFQAFCLSICSISTQPGSAQSIDRPNILLLVADDLGYEKVGAYNGLSALTPHLDQLAGEGLLFLRAYASPVCTPSRMSLYTGTYATTHQYTSVLPVHLGSKDAVDFSQWTTYAQLLGANGYHTAVTGKWQLAGLEFHPRHCASAGFDSWCVWQIWRNGQKTRRYWKATLNEDGKIRDDIQDRFGPDVLTDYVIRQMKSAQDQGRPFCIQHNMMLPHVPIIETPDDKAARRAPGLDQMINYMDKQVGLLLAAINEMGIEENTVVIFIGDNGTQSKEPRRTPQGMVKGGKWTLTDGGMHVPLMIRYPKVITAGRKAESLIDITDFFPTICDLSYTSMEDLNGIDGKSFYPLLINGDYKSREWITGGFENDYVIFDGEWRYHHNEEELWDCRDLPRETLSTARSKEAEDAHTRLSEILAELLAKD